MNTFEKIYEVVKGIPKGKVASGFAFGAEGVQRQLFEAEGIVFEQDGRIDLSKYSIKIR